MAELEALYSNLWAAHTDEFALLDRSLAPRSWAFLFDIDAASGPRTPFRRGGCGMRPG